MVLNLNKNSGITSQEAVTQIKRILGVRKAGHAGTLDPVAEGVLLVCLNESTKLTGYLSELDKVYTVRMKLGERTDTFDSEGRIIDKAEGFSLDHEIIVETLKRFEGRIIQRVPPYSAVKRSGIPFYKLARKGIVFDTPSREVFIEKIEFMGFNGLYLMVKVYCSKGTYIRRLCDDIGIALGTFAHVTELRRDRVGHFRVEESSTIEDVNNGRFSLIPPDIALEHLEPLRFNRYEARLLINGQTLFLNKKVHMHKKVRLYDGDKFFGVGIVEDAKVRLERLIRSPGTEL